MSKTVKVKPIGCNHIHYEPTVIDGAVIHSQYGFLLEPLSYSHIHILSNDIPHSCSIDIPHETKEAKKP